MVDYTARDFGRLEGKIDQLLEMRKEDRLIVVETEKRLRKLEARGHWAAGFAAAFGALLGIGSVHLPRL